MPVSYTSPVTLVFAAATLIVAVLAAYGWRRRSEAGNAFALMMLSMAVWSGAQTLAVVSTDPQTRLVLERLKWIGIVTAPPTFLLFAGRYAGYDRWTTRRRLGVLCLSSAVVLAGVWLNPGELVWIDPTVEVVGGVTVLQYEPGPMYWVSVAYAYVLGVPATTMLAGLALTGDDLYLGQTVSVLVGSVVPLIAGGLSAVSVTPMTLDLTPVAFAVTGIAFAYALVRHDFLAVVPATRRIGRDAVVRNMRDGVVVVDERDRVIDLNPVAERVLGADRSTLLGRSVADLSGVERVDDGFGGDVQTPGGQLYEADSAPLLAVEQRRLGAVITLRDVTELRTRQQRLTVLNRVLRHNLRNDMNAIEGYATILADRYEARPAEQVREVSTDVVDLADKARQIERVMARRGETRAAPAGALAESVVADVAARHDAAFTVVTPEPSVHVPGRGILRPALENVVENAVEHNDADDPTVEVLVEVTGGDEPAVVYRVADDGPGIPPQERRVLLEGTETPLAHGSGLGLWLVYWAIESLDGTVAFEDSDPRGSVVTLEVPVAEGSSRTAGPGDADATDASGTDSGETNDCAGADD